MTGSGRRRDRGFIQPVDVTQRIMLGDTYPPFPAPDRFSLSLG